MIKPVAVRGARAYGQVAIVQNWLSELERLVPTD
jgi:hypothetical protein